MFHGHITRDQSRARSLIDSVCGVCVQVIIGILKMNAIESGGEKVCLFLNCKLLFVLCCALYALCCPWRWGATGAGFFLSNLHIIGVGHISPRTFPLSLGLALWCLNLRITALAWWMFSLSQTLFLTFLGPLISNFPHSAQCVFTRSSKSYSVDSWQARWYYVIWGAWETCAWMWSRKLALPPSSELFLDSQSSCSRSRDWMPSHCRSESYTINPQTVVPHNPTNWTFTVFNVQSIRRSQHSTFTAFNVNSIQRSQHAPFTAFNGHSMQRSQHATDTACNRHSMQRSQHSTVTACNGHSIQSSQHATLTAFNGHSIHNV